MMRQMVSRSRWAVEICGVFLHPIQPLAHERLAQHILFDIHKMSGPIEHGERRSGVVVQQIPGVPVSTEVVLSCGQHERGTTKGGGKSVHVKGKGAGLLQPLVEDVVGYLDLRQHVAHRLDHRGGLYHDEACDRPKLSHQRRVFYKRGPGWEMGLCGICLHLGGTEQQAIDRGCPVVDHATGQVPTIGQTGEHEALTGDDRVDERQHRIEHLIVRGQTVHARGAPRAGQIRIEAQPAVSLREEGFYEPHHDAVIARSPRQHHDGLTGAVGFIVDRDISEVALHVLIPPFMRTKPGIGFGCRLRLAAIAKERGQNGFAYPSGEGPMEMSHAPLHLFMRQMSVLDREQYSTEERTKLLLSYSFCSCLPWAACAIVRLAEAVIER